MSDDLFVLEVRKFQPTYKMVLLTIHSVLVSGFSFLCYPITKLVEVVGETSTFEFYNKK